MKSFSLIVLYSLLQISVCFIAVRGPTNHKKLAMVLDKEIIDKLDAMKLKHQQLTQLGTAEAIEEKSQIDDIVQKYSTYKEIKLMMGKLRTMWRTEASERRRERQLKSFVSLSKGKAEIEESLKQKLGLPFNSEVGEPEGLAEIKRLNAEIEVLQKKLEEVEIKIPEGMSTRDERFSY